MTLLRQYVNVTYFVRIIGKQYVIVTYSGRSRSIYIADARC